MLKIAILAGEPSGDLVAAELMRALKAQYGEVSFEGIAGPKMIAEGCKPIFRVEQLSVMGVVEVLQKLPQLLWIRRSIKKHFARNLPDILIGIDAPDFNLNVEAFFKKRHVPTVHYNSPTVWAWRESRIKTIANAVSLMLTLFPFEAEIYERHHIPVKFIGHPLADAIPEIVDTKPIRSELGFDENAKVVALLPGSRASEIKHLGPLFLETAKWCLERDKTLQFIVPMIDEARCSQFRKYSEGLPVNFPLKVWVGNTQQVLAASDAVLVASGTATLETALLKKPMVVAYRFNWINYQIAKRLINVPYFALPNLLLNKLAVPEFFQEKATVSHLGEALLAQLADLNNPILQEDFNQVRTMLRHSASEKAARAVLGVIKENAAVPK